MSLTRFHEAQADARAGYDTALEEIRRGGKTSHWIWYIFPQLAGLGHSNMAARYAVRDLAEACDYLRDPLLRARYKEISAAVSDQLARGRALEDLMGSRIDALKLVSSLTLFRIAAENFGTGDRTASSLVERSSSLLAAIAKQGFEPCAHTIAAVVKKPA